MTALLADLDGRVLGSLSKDVSESASADDRLERLRSTVAELLRRSGVSRGSLRAVGVGSPGIIEADGAVRLCSALPEWTGLNLGERLSRSFKCSVLVENDANAAAVAEHWKGAAAESDDMVFVLAGLSPGAGSLIGGGCTGATAARPGRSARCTCWAARPPRRRCCRPRASPCIRSTSRRSPRSSNAREGDERAREAVDRFIQRLVHDVTALVLALDPELVVVGGWATGIDDVLDPLRQELARYCLRPPRVALSRLGEAAVAMGALRLALDHVEEQLFAVEGTVTARR